MPALPPWNWEHDCALTEEEIEQLNQYIIEPNHDPAWRIFYDAHSTEIVCADHFNGWLKWFYHLCPSMAPKIPICPVHYSYKPELNLEGSITVYEYEIIL